MSAVLLDTHFWAYTLYQSDRIGRNARAANDAATRRIISSVSVYEIAQKVRLGKWPEMAPLVGALTDIAARQELEIAVPDAAICLRAGLMDWAHRDPFDRLLAATALTLGLPILSADPVFDGVVPRVW